MKYGFLFSILALLLVVSSIVYGGLAWLLLWPALSGFIIGAGYFGLGPRVYGKRANGVLSPSAILPLLPYLIYMWSVWRFARLVKREAAYDRLTDELFIGRRLLSHEAPAEIDVVVDLTSEFTEPEALRAKDYRLFPILDGFVPSVDRLLEWAREIDSLEGRKIYIHCAEGHGRTGLFAGTLLLMKGEARTPKEALEMMQAKRPLVNLGARQMEMLRLVARRLENHTAG